MEGVKSQIEGLPRASAAPRSFDNIAMQGGVDDESSYARNSSMQAGNIESTWQILMQALEMMELPSMSSGSVRVADLGCSSGPNTISLISKLVNTLQQRYEAQGLSVPEFEAFFADLPTNDFNTLFSFLPAYAAASEGAVALANDLNQRSYFAAGVPGNFYNRLFPKASLHAVLTTNSLHWLSQVPKAIQNKHSPAWNRGQIWISPSNKMAAQEYSRQAKEDLQRFLTCRAQEMARGSLIFMLMSGRVSPDPEHQLSYLDTNDNDLLDEWTNLIENCFKDLIEECVIEEEDRDSFNLPMYLRSVDELEEAVKELSVFTMHSTKLVKISTMDFYGEEGGEGEDATGGSKSWYNISRSLIGPLIEAKFGSCVAHVFFQRLKARVAKIVKHVGKASSYAILVGSLIRK